MDGKDILRLAVSRIFLFSWRDGPRSYKGQTSPICSFAVNEIPAQISPEVLHEKGNSKYLDNNATKVLLEL